MIRVKICGIRSLEEALWAVEAGADALGFILVPKSKRYIEPEKLQHITSHLPPFITKVGVFAQESPAKVAEIARQCSLDTIQLHGGETVDAYRNIQAPKIRAICFDPQAFGNFQNPNPSGLASEFKQGLIQGVLLDSNIQGQTGGTGIPLPWEDTHFQAILGSIKATGCPVLLAGGLNPDNIQEAVQLTHPYGVDVSSGVEEDGRKNRNLIFRFVQSVKSL